MGAPKAVREQAALVERTRAKSMATCENGLVQPYGSCECWPGVPCHLRSASSPSRGRPRAPWTITAWWWR
jgi:hypothetical protein